MYQVCEHCFSLRLLPHLQHWKLEISHGNIDFSWHKPTANWSGTLIFISMLFCFLLHSKTMLHVIVWSTLTTIARFAFYRMERMIFFIVTRSFCSSSIISGMTAGAWVRGAWGTQRGRTQGATGWGLTGWGAIEWGVMGWGATTMTMIGSFAPVVEEEVGQGLLDLFLCFLTQWEWSDLDDSKNKQNKQFSVLFYY